jgi:hypothetical protein
MSLTTARPPALPPPRKARARARRRARWAALAGGGLLVVCGLLLLVQTRLAVAIEGRILRTTGHRASVGSASLRGRTVVARDVIVFGAPPFDAEPLARIERLEVRLGGSRGFWSPADLLADGVEVEYLGTGTIDNVGRASSSGSGSGGSAPRVRVRRGRLRGMIHPARGPRVYLRARDFSLDVGPEGDRSVALEGVVAEVAGWLTAALPELVVNSEPHGAITVHGESASLAVPGGGPLVEELTVDGSWSPRKAELAVTREPGAGRPKASPRVRANFRADDQGAQLSLDAGDLALRPLHAWLDRMGLLVDGTRADLHLLASLEGSRTEVPFELDVRARGLDVHNPAIDNRPWRDFPVELHATGAFEPSTSKLRLDPSELDAAGLRLTVDGWSELGATPRGSWRVRTPAPLACGRLLAEVPQPVREALGGMKLAGNLGLAVSVGFDAAAWDTLSLDLRIDPLCEVTSEPTALAELLPTLRGRVAPPSGGPPLPVGKYDPDFAPLAKMPAHLPAAFLTAEDGRFFSHHGFDLEMIRRALAHDLEMRAFAKGGSTIVQQLAKNLFLVQSRTLARKLEETVLAWRLATLIDKRRLLEIYLNVIELGPGIRGVKQAARAYFGKELSALRPIESAHLAALTPNPAGLARRFRDGRVDDGWLQRLYDLLGMMNRSGRLSRSDLATARAGTLTLRKI